MSANEIADPGAGISPDNQGGIHESDEASTRRQLYVWQREALRVWRRKNHRGAIEAVTGAGKTKIGLYAIGEALHEMMRAVIVVPTGVLMHQWETAVHQEFPGVSVGLMGDGRHDTASSYDVVIGIVNSVAKSFSSGHRPVLDAWFHGLIVADECHRYGADTFSEALSDNFEWRLGLTATYERSDHRDHDVLDPYFGGIIYRIWYDRALADRVISPFDVALLPVTLHGASRGKYDDLTDKIDSRRRELLPYFDVLPATPQEFLDTVLSWADRKTPDPYRWQLARSYVKAWAERRTLLSGAPEKIVILGVLSDAVRASHGALIFTQTKNSAAQAVAQLQQSGARATAVFSGLSDEERRAGLKEFKDRQIDALAAPRVLDEGVDVPEADLGIILGSNKSRRQMVQRLGRVIRRKSDGRIGKFIVIYARHTVEDPAVSGGEHLANISEFAHQRLSLPDGDEGSVRILETFLRNPPNQQAAAPPEMIRPDQVDLGRGWLG